MFVLSFPMQTETVGLTISLSEVPTTYTPGIDTVFGGKVHSSSNKEQYEWENS